MIKQFIYNMFLMIDQALNVFPLLGDPDESISTRCARVICDDRYEPKWFVIPLAKFIDLLFWNALWKIEKDHIRNSREETELGLKEIWKWHK